MPKILPRAKFWSPYSKMRTGISTASKRCRTRFPRWAFRFSYRQKTSRSDIRFVKAANKAKAPCFYGSGGFFYCSGTQHVLGRQRGGKFDFSVMLLMNSCLGCGKFGYRYPEWATAYIVDIYSIKKLNRPRLAGLLSANSDFNVLSCSTCQEYRGVPQSAYTFNIYNLEGVVFA